MTGMEVAFFSFLINKLGGIAVDRAQSRCSQLLPCITPPSEIHARVGRITREFELMLAFVESNWSTAANKLLEVWIGQVYELASNIEGIIDEYKFLVERQQQRAWKNCCLVALSDLCYNLDIAFRGIDSGLEKMEKDLSELSSRKGRYVSPISGNDDRVRNSENDTQRYRAYSPMLINENDLVGIEENKSKLVSWLTDANTCSQMKAIAVWGMGGHGKTTLVSNVYRNKTVKSHFDCQVWVNVSQTYSVEELLRTMIHEIFKEKNEPVVPNGIATMLELELFEIIRESLQQKKYMVVLDDIWSIDSWNKIKHAFVDSKNGSRLVVTTRWIEIARIANNEHIIELQQLNENDAWKLFCKKAFPTENNKKFPIELEDYTGRILNKCQGSPLAIEAFGSLLSKREKNEDEWKKVHDCFPWELENNTNLNIIFNLSFDDLPNYLKNCCVYCSIFPEDNLIKRKKLIRLWVAEEFVEAKNDNRLLEEVAEDYLSELVDRSILQVVRRNEFGRLKAFRMHNIARLTTLAISRKKNFCMILDGSQSNLDNQTSRVSIQRNDIPLRLNTSLSRLGSLIVFSTLNFSSSFLRDVLSRFKMLKVLELEKIQISNLPNEISALFKLHYLGLRGTKVEQLSENIQKLQSLQTLDLRDSNIVKLPHGVTQLKQLRHLFVPAGEVESGCSTVVCCVSTLKGACQWKNLQTLRSVKANKKLVQQLGDMEELRSLEVVEVEQAHCPQLCTSLNKMNNLRSLRLYARSEKQLNFETLNSPPPRLQKLVLSGRLSEGKVPTFIHSCSELVFVQLFGSQLTADSLPSLGQLCKLVGLNLWDDAYEEQNLHFKTGSFPRLKVLSLTRLKNLNEIVIEEGAMARLHELVMTDLPEVKTVPCGIEFLTHLHILSVKRMPEELVRKLREDYGNEDPQRRISLITD